MKELVEASTAVANLVATMHSTCRTHTDALGGGALAQTTNSGNFEPNNVDHGSLEEPEQFQETHSDAETDSCSDGVLTPTSSVTIGNESMAI